jgi:hypothetical protein
LEKIIAALAEKTGSDLKNRKYGLGIRCTDHVTCIYPQKLALTSPTSGGRSVCIIRSQTKATEFSFSSVLTPHSSVATGVMKYLLGISILKRVVYLQGKLLSCLRLSSSEPSLEFWDVICGNRLRTVPSVHSVEALQ